MNETVFQMPRMNLRLLLVACVACISFACADSGTVPEPDPEPAPVPVPVPVPEETEPYLEVSPAMLRFDVAGNALGEKSFVVKTNCPWRLDIPKEADWLEASDVAGKGLDTVSFRLYIDRTYHTADLVFTAECADGRPALTQSVTVQQGTEPAEPDPSDPDTPDDNPPGPSNPDDPGGDSKDDPDQNPDDPGGDSKDDPDQNPDDPGGDSKDDSDQNPDDPGGDSKDDPDQNPDDPSGDSKDDPDQNPDDPTPEVPPVVQVQPSIVAVDPTFLWWNADDRGQTKQVAVYVANFDGYTLDVSIEGAYADRFEVQSPVRDGLVVRVGNVGVNDSDVDYTASLVISVKNGNSLSVPLTQVKRMAGSNGDKEDDDKGDSGEDAGSGGDSGGGSGTPSDDNDSGGGNTPPPTENDSNDTARGGGSDDFTHLKPESLFKNRVGPTPAGWCGEYCAVYSGGGYDSDPTYPSLLGTRAKVKGLAMNGKTTAVGRIVSPEIAGGCGTLSFDYGITDAGDRRVDFTVEILQNGVAVRTFRVERTAEKFKKYTFTGDVRVSGRFQIVFTNNCPSKQARDKDRYTIFHIEWTGLKQTENNR